MITKPVRHDPLLKEHQTVIYQVITFSLFDQGKPVMTGEGDKIDAGSCNNLMNSHEENKEWIVPGDE